MTTSTRLRAIGIDVGFFATKYTTGRVAAGNARAAISTGQFPSVAPFQHVAAAGPAGELAADGVRLTVEGVSHYIGRDTLLEAGGWGMTGFAEDWSTSTAYKALFRGALHQIARANEACGELVIEMLVAGLPVASCASYAARAEAFILEPHRLPDPVVPGQELTVRVLRTRVLGQPQGALVNHSCPGDHASGPGR